MTETELKLWVKLGKWIETEIKDADRNGVFVSELAALAFLIAEILQSRTD